MTRILIIEDDPALQDAYGFVLRSVGHRVTSAYNGQEGLDLALKKSYDLILLDLHMPVMNGLQFLEAYQSHLTPSTAIVVFSNMVEPDTNKRALQLGAERCILKSTMTPTAMIALIQELSP